MTTPPTAPPTAISPRIARLGGAETAISPRIAHSRAGVTAP